MGDGLQQLAASLGLSVRSTSRGELIGEVDGLEVRLRSMRGGQEVSIPLPSVPQGFAMALARAGRERKHLHVGVPLIDRAFEVTQREPAAVARLLRVDGVAEALIALGRQAPHFLINHRRLWVPLPGELSESERGSAASAALRLARLLEQTARAQQGTPEPLPDDPAVPAEWARRKQEGARWPRIGLGLLVVALAVSAFHFTWTKGLLAALVGVFALVVFNAVGKLTTVCPRCSLPLDVPLKAPRCTRCGVLLE